MMKAALSFAFGGLVVFVPQGVKTQEKKPAKVKVEIVELQDVTEPVEILEVEVPLVIALDQIQGQAGKGLSKRDLVEIATVLDRLDTLKVKVRSLDGKAQHLDRSLIRLQEDASHKGSKVPGKHSQAELHRQLAELETQRVAISETRSRLLAQISRTRRKLAQTKASQAIEANRRAAELAIEANRRATDLAVQRNAARAQEQVQRNVDRAKVQYFKASKAALKGTNYRAYLEFSKLKAELQAKADALDALKAAESSLKWRKEARTSVNGRAEVAKLEREIVRLTGELARLKVGRSRANLTRFPTPPGPSAPSKGRTSGGWSTLGPRSSGSRRSAPSTLGAEGKVIWNELQGIRGEIRALRKLLEAHMKSGSRKTRTGSARRGSVGRRNSSGKTRSGVTSSRTGYLSLPVGKKVMGSDGKTFQVTKGMTFFFENGQLHQSVVPDLYTTNRLEVGKQYTIPLPDLRYAPSPYKAPKAPKSRASGGARTWQWGYAPGKRRVAPAPATPSAPGLPPVHEHKKHKGYDKKKSKARRGNVIYWGGADAVPAPRASKKNELQRL